MKNRILKLAIVFLIFIGFPQAEELSGVPGAFVPLPLGAKGGSIGGIQVANPIVSESQIYNPAGLNRLEKMSFSYNYLSQLNLISFHNGSFAYRPDSSLFVYGASLTENGDDVYREGELLLGVSSAFKELDIGINWKWRYATTGGGGSDFINPEGKNTKVEGSGFGASGFDIGGIWNFHPRLKLGMVIKDAFSAISWSTKNEAGTAKGDYVEFIPTTVKFGFSSLAFDWWEINLDFQPTAYEDGKVKFGFGSEWLPLYFLEGNTWKKMVQIRWAIEQNIADDNVNRKWSFGGGLYFPFTNGYKLRIDGGYRINTTFDSQNTPLVGLSLTK